MHDGVDVVAQAAYKQVGEQVGRRLLYQSILERQIAFHQFLRGFEVVVAGFGKDLASCIPLAEQSIDSGAALRKLQLMVEASRA